MLVGLPVSAAVYLVTCRSINLEQELRLAATADFGLDPDDRIRVQEPVPLMAPRRAGA